MTPWDWLHQSLQGKLLYHDACEEKRSWDAPLSAALVHQWQKWESSLPQQIICPRAITCVQESIENIELHAFRDASGNGVAAAMYAVVKIANCTKSGTCYRKGKAG